MSEADCYIGVNAAGFAVTAAVDNPEHKAETAKSIAGWIRDGLTVERRSVEWVRKNLGKMATPEQANT